LLPGFVVGLILCFMVWMRARHDTNTVPRASAGAIGRSLVIAVPALVLPFLIRGAVVGGVATATEVSTIGIVYSALVGLLVYREFDWRRLVPCWCAPRP